MSDTIDLKEGAKLSPAIFTYYHNLVNENGKPIEFADHKFLLDPYADNSPKQVARKSTQVGWSTLAIIKALHLAYYWGANVIYTLPSKSVVKDFVTPKVDPLIDSNPVIKAMIGETDSTALKKVGKRFVYFRGSWEQASAISISAHVLINDEYDRSNKIVLETYKTRLDAAQMDRPDLGLEWHFSNPSTPGAGVDFLYNQSNQKRWFIKCPHCNEQQFMEFPDNIDFKNEEYICKLCHKILDREARQHGHWNPAYLGREMVGYWINQLMVPWIPASKIIANSKGDPQIFHNFTLGLPYISKENSLDASALRDAIISDENPRTHVAIGVDVGIIKHYVIGNRYGIFRVGTTESWQEIEDLRNQYSAHMVIDANPMPDDVIRIVKKYSGKVFMAYYGEDRKENRIIRFGEADKQGIVFADRTRIFDAVVADIRAKDIVFTMDPSELEQYINHWQQMYRVIREKLTKDGGSTGIYKQEWLTIEGRPDHFAHATVYWHIAMQKTMSSSSVVRPLAPHPAREKLSPIITPDNTMPGINLKDALARANRPVRNWKNT